MDKENFKDSSLTRTTTCKPFSLEPAKRSSEEVASNLRQRELEVLVVGLVQREVQQRLASFSFTQMQCVTVKEASELLKVYEDTVRVYIRNGQLHAFKIGNDYRIRLTDLESFLQHRSLVIKMPTIRKRKKIS